MEYRDFLRVKTHESDLHGFDPVVIHPDLMDFQASLMEWATRKGRAAIFADCGLGKTLLQLCWAENVVRKTNGRVLILAPLAVSSQTVREGEKFGIEVSRSRDGSALGRITVTNYERLHHFNQSDFVGCVCDESSILKNFDGTYKAQITDFMRKMSYRLLCTATAAPNDYVELGTSSEALGELGFMDMLGRFFKNEQNPTCDTRRKFRGDVPKWRFKYHAEEPFWRWMCSWARAIRKPSDLGFDDGPLVLPRLIESGHVVKAETPRNGMLFDLPAVGLKEQREERRHTLTQRCEMAADLATNHERSVLWCHLNAEGDFLERLVPESVQVCGHQSDDEKEEKLLAFLSGEAKRLVTKPMCAGFGLNMQHCNHMTFFPSHSYEQYYQSVRRCWRFGQKRDVTVDVVSSVGDANVLANLQKKAAAADRMFSSLVRHMSDSIQIHRKADHNKPTEVPPWLSQSN